MKKLLLLITGLFILASAEGQILRYSNYTAPTPPVEEELRGPDELYDGHTKAWYAFDTLISVTDNAVTQWNDLSGNGYHLLPYATDGSEGTADNRPAWHVTNGVTFDGTDDAMRVMIAGWTTAGTIYAVISQESWTDDDVMFGYAGTGSIRVAQNYTAEGGSPNLHLIHSSGSSLAITGLATQTRGILVMHVDIATNVASLALNGGTAVENTADMAGFTSGGVLLGATHAAYPALQRWGNIRIWEIIYRDQVDSGDTLTAIYNYLDAKYL